jgi:hypothetical protein
VLITVVQPVISLSKDQQCTFGKPPGQPNAQSAGTPNGRDGPANRRSQLSGHAFAPGALHLDGHRVRGDPHPTKPRTPVQPEDPPLRLPAGPIARRRAEKNALKAASCCPAFPRDRRAWFYLRRVFAVARLEYGELAVALIACTR